MNEKIKQLAEEAADSTRVVHNNAYWHMMDEIPEDKTWREKFAELIVAECVDICNTTTDRGYLNGAVAGNKIKQHFGVKK